MHGQLTNHPLQLFAHARAEGCCAGIPAFAFVIISGDDFVRVIFGQPLPGQGWKPGINPQVVFAELLRNMTENIHFHRRYIVMEIHALDVSITFSVSKCL